MKKIDKIDGCYHCPLRQRNRQGQFCLHVSVEGRRIMDESIIPLWCPLPNDDVFEEYCSACGKTKPNCINDPHSNLGNPSFVCLDCLR